MAILSQTNCYLMAKSRADGRKPEFIGTPSLGFSNSSSRLPLLSGVKKKPQFQKQIRGGGRGNIFGLRPLRRHWMSRCSVLDWRIHVAEAIQNHPARVAGCFLMRQVCVRWLAGRVRSWLCSNVPLDPGQSPEMSA